MVLMHCSQFAKLRLSGLCRRVLFRDGSNLYLIWSAWFDLKIYLVPSFAWFGLIWRFKYLGLIWLEQFENCKCLTWLGLVFKYLKKAWAWSFDFLKGLIWLEKYKPESEKRMPISRIHYYDNKTELFLFLLSSFFLFKIVS